MKILFLGDSITDSNRNFTSDNLGEGYVRILADRFPNHQFINRGHDGFTTQHVLRTLAEDCLCRSFDLITLLVGINDISVQLYADSHRIPEEFALYYETIVEKIRQTSKAPIILAEPFVFDRPAALQNWRPFLREESQIIQKLSVSYNCCFLPLQSVLDDACLRWDSNSLTSDGIHLTPLGSGLIADAWENLVTSLIFSAALFGA